MELMQRCLPFKWQKYWNCGTKEFDLLMILQDIDNLLLARIWTGKENSLGDIKEAVHLLDEEQREILADWMGEHEFCEVGFSHTSACPCCAGQLTHS